MQLTKERVEMLRAAMTKEDSNFMFRTQNGDEYGIWEKSTNFFPKDTEECDGAADEELYGKELTAMIFLGWEDNKEINREIEDWEEFSKHVGITELQVLGTKVPTIIKTRFEFFANETSTTSAVLRGLVYDYVKRQMTENMDKLIFKEKI